MGCHGFLAVACDIDPTPKFFEHLAGNLLIHGIVFRYQHSGDSGGLSFGQPVPRDQRRRSACFRPSPVAGPLTNRQRQSSNCVSQGFGEVGIDAEGLRRTAVTPPSHGGENDHSGRGGGGVDFHACGRLDPSIPGRCSSIKARSNGWWSAAALRAISQASGPSWAPAQSIPYVTSC